MIDTRKRKDAKSDKRKAKKELPTKTLIPNAVTIAAIREARRGGLKRFRNVKALLKSLNEDD